VTTVTFKKSHLGYISDVKTGGETMNLPGRVATNAGLRLLILSAEIIQSIWIVLLLCKEGSRRIRRYRKIVSK